MRTSSCGRSAYSVKSRGLVCWEQARCCGLFPFMSANQGSFDRRMARVLAFQGGLLRVAATATVRPRHGRRLLKRIKTVHASSRQTYGAPRLDADLRGLASATAAADRRLTPRRSGRRQPRHGGPQQPATQGRAPWPDLVDRDFSATTEPAVGCRHHLCANDGRVPLSRRRARRLEPQIVGWAMANHLRAELVLDAMEMAVGQRRPKRRPPQRQ